MWSLGLWYHVVSSVDTIVLDAEDHNLNSDRFENLKSHNWMFFIPYCGYNKIVLLANNFYTLHLVTTKRISAIQMDKTHLVVTN
jgi:hypothetical protein